MDSVIADGNARKIFLGQLISQACDKVMSVGIIWVLTVRFSPRWIPWFIGIGALPHALFAAYSGKWIGRRGALRTVVGADAFRGVLFLAAAWLAVAVRSGAALLAILLAAALISNAAGSFFNPAILSLPVEMMPPGAKRDKLTALLDSCFSFGNVLGPLVSAIAYALAGLGGLLAINGASYLFSALLAYRIKPGDGMAPAGAPPELDDPAALAPRTALQVLKSEPVVAGMLGRFLVINFFLAPVMIFMPWYVRHVYGAGIAGLATLEVFLGAGTLAGSVFLSVAHLPGATWKRITSCGCAVGLAYLAFTFSRGLAAGCASLAALGFFLALANVLILNFFQTGPSPRDVPGVMGLVNLISVASLPVSMGVAGAFIEDVPVKSFAVSCAAVMIAAAVSVGFIPGVRGIA